MKRTIIVIMLVLEVTFGLFAAGSGEKEERITAYTTLDEELAREVFKAFTAETGIRVDWVRLSTAIHPASPEYSKTGKTAGNISPFGTFLKDSYTATPQRFTPYYP